MKQPVDYINHIREHFLAARAERISRYSEEWGYWSRNMNVEVRKRIEGDDPDTLGLKYVFIYWTLISGILEIIAKPTVSGIMMKQSLTKDALEIRGMIESGELKPFPKQMDEIWKF